MKDPPSITRASSLYSMITYFLLDPLRESFSLLPLIIKTSSWSFFIGNNSTYPLDQQQLAQRYPQSPAKFFSPGFATLTPPQVSAPCPSTDPYKDEANPLPCPARRSAH
jgi:hypothetical protein